MPKVSVVNMAGAQVGEIELNDSIFGIEPNQYVMHAVVVNYLANQRQGTQSTKTRSEVSGGGKKPWRQKGTGRARQGSTRAPQWRHGGIALGPKPRDYRYTLNKKVRRLALKSAFSTKVQDNKTIVEMLKSLGVEGKALIVLAGKNDNVYYSARNIPGVEATLTNTLNVYDILNHDKFIIVKDAVAKLEEVYA